MTRALRDFRLLPLVLLAAVALLVLKSYGLLFDGGYIFGPPAREDAQPAAAADPNNTGDVVGSINPPPQPAAPDDPAVTAPMMPVAPPQAGPPNRQSWAQEMFNFPADITGSVGASKKEAPAGPPGDTKIRNESGATQTVRTAARTVEGKPSDVVPQRPASASERAILERLQDRRKDLEVRARELDMREALLKAAQMRLENRVKELKQVEGRIKVGHEKKDEATAARFKGLVAMYENMKAKDAARIFDRLELKILAELAGQINPRRMADILANMSSEAAERLTVEFANRGNGAKAQSAADLPKIEGKPDPGP